MSEVKAAQQATPISERTDTLAIEEDDAAIIMPLKKQPKAEVLCIGGGGFGTAGGGLQKNFERFRKAKQDEVKYRNFMAAQAMPDRRDPEVKRQLRQKFIDGCRKYFGVPYAKRYHKPGDPLYDAPIFLDCCALVRQVVYDLREDFGFKLDRWNQAY